MFKSRVIVVVAAVLCMASLSLAQPVDEQGQGQENRKDFRRGFRMLAEADQDGDGALSWDEFKNAHEARLKERFSRLDADQNGMIEEEEIQAAAQWRQGRMGGRRGLKGSIEN